MAEKFKIKLIFKMYKFFKTSKIQLTVRFLITFLKKNLKFPKFYGHFHMKRIIRFSVVVVFNFYCAYTKTDVRWSHCTGEWSTLKNCTQWIVIKKKTRSKDENDDKRKLHLMSEFYFQSSIWSIVNDHFSLKYALFYWFINPII